MANRSLISTASVSVGVYTFTWEHEQKITRTNEETFEVLLATLTPDLYVIFQALRLFHINGEVLPTVIKAMGDIVYSSKLGEVIIEIRPDPKTGEAIVRRVRSIDTRHLDLQALDTPMTPISNTFDK
jgi:hypothetical protein